MARRWMLLTLVVLAALPAAARPAASPGGAELARRLIAAHGGMDAWRAAPSIRFEHTLEIPGDPDPWVSVETIEQGRRRVHQEWPRDGARLAFDGERVWTLGWKRDNPPRFMVHLVYYFLNLPWLTQDPGVRLEAGELARLPGEAGEYRTLRMSFDSGVGDTPGDVYVLYLDPKTDRMKATSYTVTYGAVLDLLGLPPDARQFGPLIHVYEDYTTVDGLVFPSRYRTLDPKGKVYGHHRVGGFSIRTPFDASRLRMPPGGVIDTSSARRKGAATPATGYDWANVRIDASRVAGNVWMLAGAGGNIGVSVGEDGILIVDDQYAPLAPKIELALRRLDPGPVRFVLNTHWHGDHTGGNEAFGKGAPVVAQTNVRTRLATGGTLSNGRAFEPAPRSALPVLTFDDRLTIHLNGEDVRAIHFGRGHTDGDAIVFFTGSGVVHMGDTFVHGGYLPFIDFNSGGSVRGLLATVEAALADLPAGTRIIPGHGPVAGRPELEAYARMLRGATTRIAALLEQGRSLDAVRAAAVLRPWGSWDAESEGRFVEALYTGLRREAWR